MHVYRMRAGLFRGKREPVPTSLANRLTKIAFQELSQHEWCNVISLQLQSAGIPAADAQRVASGMLAIHLAVMTTVTAHTFPEVSIAHSQRHMLAECLAVIV